MRNATITTILIGSALSMQGCGTLIGAGVGALAGQAIAGNTTGTLIGAGIGAASGYIIENEIQKQERLQREQNQREQDILRERERGYTTTESNTRRVLNEDGTITETGTEVVHSEKVEPGYNGLPQ